MQQFCPGPLPMDPTDKLGKKPLYIKFGKHMPKDKKEKDGKKKKKKKAPKARKKDEKPPKPILWAPPRPQPYPVTADLMA